MSGLLIQPPYLYPTSYALRTELLGLSYLAASLRRAGHDVSIFDSTINAPKKITDHLYYYGACEEDIKDRILRYSPDVLGISCHYAYNSPETFKIALMAKRINSQMITVIGGCILQLIRKWFFMNVIRSIMG